MTLQIGYEIISLLGNSIKSEDTTIRDAKPRLLIRALKAEGFVENGGTKHLKMVKSVGEKTIVIHLQHQGVIKSKTVARLQKQTGISKEKFYSYKF